MSAKWVGLFVAGWLAVGGCDAAEEPEPRGTATAQEACTQDGDCIVELFCHPEDKVCVISLDPCVGIDFVGICDGEIATWCENESLKGKDCSEVGKECGLNPSTGLFDCLEPTP